MKKQIVMILLIAALLFPGRALCAEDPNRTRERIIGGAFKGFAEAVLVVTDLEKEKKKFIEKIDSSAEDEFDFQYGRYWRLIRELPLSIRLKYGISEHMTRDQLAEQVRSLTKNDLHAMIQGIPDSVIAREFDRRLKRMGGELQRATLPQQVQAVWEKVNARLGKAQPSKER